MMIVRNVKLFETKDLEKLLYCLEEMTKIPRLGWLATPQPISSRPMVELVFQVISFYPTNWFSSIYGDIEILNTPIGKNLQKLSPEMVKKNLDIDADVCYSSLEFVVREK
jgi:hypothetical protein